MSQKLKSITIAGQKFDLPSEDIQQKEWTEAIVTEDEEGPFLNTTIPFPVNELMLIFWEDDGGDIYSKAVFVYPLKALTESVTEGLGIQNTMYSFFLHSEIETVSGPGFVFIDNGITTKTISIATSVGIYQAKVFYR